MPTSMNYAKKMERDEESFSFSAPGDDIFSVSSILKLYLRELSDPLFKFPLPERMHYTENKDEHVTNDFRILKAKIRRLPTVNQFTLRRLLIHLAKVAAHSEKNKMDVKNLAIVFGAVVFGEDELSKSGDILNYQTSKDVVMEDLITQASRLFEDHGADSSPPLPAAPPDEPQAKVDYGSSYTQITTLPPKVESSSTLSDDFTPQIPARPDDSIHPSRRTRPISQDLPQLSIIAETSDDNGGHLDAVALDEADLNRTQDRDMHSTDSTEVASAD